MKTIVKTLLMVLLPLLGFTQEGNVRFTDQYIRFTAPINRITIRKQKADCLSVCQGSRCDVEENYREIIDLREK